jgi:hypothetical protein
MADAVAQGPKEPPAQVGMPLQPICLAHQQDEHRLGHILGQVLVPQLTRGGAIHPVAMKANQFGKRLLVSVAAIVLQQLVLLHAGGHPTLDMPADPQSGQDPGVARRVWRLGRWPFGGMIALAASPSTPSPPGRPIEAGRVASSASPSSLACSPPAASPRVGSTGCGSGGSRAAAPVEAVVGCR